MGVINQKINTQKFIGPVIRFLTMKFEGLQRISPKVKVISGFIICERTHEL